MIQSEFAIGTYEINLMTNEERDYMFNNLTTVSKYIDTAVNYNNDYLLSNYKDIQIISKLAPCHFESYEFLVKNHLKCLQRDYIDIMLIHSDRGEWQPLAEKMVNDGRFRHVGVSNFSVEGIKEFRRLFGKFPEYNEIEINPRYVDIETINFCKENNIKLIAYCIFGGKYNAMRYVADFSVPYLIAFAAHYADIVIIRADSHRQTNAFVEAIKSYEIPNDISFEPVADTKSMQPMKYPVVPIQKYYNNELTYQVDCGENKGNLFKSKVEMNMYYPEYEMLGDYTTTLRYLFRQNYSNGKIYDRDFLIGDDGKYYTVYLINSKNMLTKVNIDAEIKTYQLEVICKD